MNILVSACLIGTDCRYDGTSKTHNEVLKRIKEHTLIPVCPEMLGGLCTPREPSEKQGELVKSKTGADVTKEFAKGADEVLKLARLYDCKLAILKEKSPSCGAGKIYDGSFSGTLIEGNGITAEVLMQHGIQVVGESKVAETIFE